MTWCRWPFMPFNAVHETWLRCALDQPDDTFRKSVKLRSSSISYGLFFGALQTQGLIRKPGGGGASFQSAGAAQPVLVHTKCILTDWHGCCLGIVHTKA